MSSTIFQAPQFDPVRARRKRNLTITIILSIALLASLGWYFRYWRYEHLVDQFFTAVEKKDYETAYGIWIADKNWKQHPEQHKNYRLNEFYLDWGPGSEFGLIKSHKVEGASTPRGGGSGVVVVVTVNERLDPKARIWIEKKDKTFTFSPY